MEAKDENRVVLITGASSGIGYHCALHLHGLGYRVYGTSRRAAQITDGESGEGRYPFTMIQMDVNEDSSVEEGVFSIIFYPQGNTSGGFIRLQPPEEDETEINYYVTIDPVTGKPKIDYEE